MATDKPKVKHTSVLKATISFYVPFDASDPKSVGPAYDKALAAVKAVSGIDGVVPAADALETRMMRVPETELAPNETQAGSTTATAQAAQSEG